MVIVVVKDLGGQTTAETLSKFSNKPLQGMAPTECLPRACLLTCLLTLEPP